MWNLLAQSDGSEAAVAAGMGVFFLVYVLYFVVAYVGMAYMLMTLANRYGIANSWMAWVPIANLYLATQIAELEIMWFVISLFCGIATFYVLWKIAERIGKPTWSVLLFCVPCVSLAIPFWWVKEE